MRAGSFSRVRKNFLILEGAFDLRMVRSFTERGSYVAPGGGGFARRSGEPKLAALN